MGATGGGATTAAYLLVSLSVLAKPFPNHSNSVPERRIPPLNCLQIMPQTIYVLSASTIARTNQSPLAGQEVNVVYPQRRKFLIRTLQ